VKVRIKTIKEEKKKAELEKRRRSRSCWRSHVLARKSSQAVRRVRRPRILMSDGRTLPPNMLAAAVIANSIDTAKRERCVFSKSEVQNFYASNKKFREIMDTGDYFFYENHLVLMIKDAFQFKDGKLSLNTDVEKFEERFCVRLLEKPDTHTVTVPVYSEKGPIGQMPVTGYVVSSKFVHATEHAKATKKAKAELADFLMMIYGDGGGGTPIGSFGATLSMHMEREHITNEYMCELTEISVRTIQRYRNDEVDPDLPYVIALCIALHLLPCLSAIMIDLAGYSLRNNKRDLAYLFLLNTEYEGGDVARCNRILIKNDLKPLTKKCS